jgi:hypothetical protein
MRIKSLLEWSNEYTVWRPSNKVQIQVGLSFPFNSSLSFLEIERANSGDIERVKFFRFLLYRYWKLQTY